MEPLYTPREISQIYGRTISEAYIRAACRRGADNHPLPHIKSGAKRPVFRISLTVFEQWLKEEMRANVGAVIAKTMCACLPAILLLGMVL